MNKTIYKVERVFYKHKGFSIWIWLLGILVFIPSIVFLAAGHYFTEKTKMVTVKYKLESGWFYKYETVTWDEFEAWKEKIDNE